MKANELSCKDLMIDDWVRIKIIQHNTKVTNIDINSVYTKAAFPIRYDEIEPISLIPEILEKNGFIEYNRVYRLDIAEGVFVNADFESKEPFVSIHNTCYYATPICKYVHQLQHALRLCGITINIEV